MIAHGDPMGGGNEDRLLDLSVLQHRNQPESGRATRRSTLVETLASIFRARADVPRVGLDDCVVGASSHDAHYVDALDRGGRRVDRRGIDRRHAVTPPERFESFAQDALDSAGAARSIAADIDARSGSTC